MEKNGLLPWRTAEIHLKLVEAFRQQTGYSRDNIKFFSSVLTHYVSDAHVPFHAVVNYDGQLHGTTWDPRAVRVEAFDRYRLILRVTPKAVAPVANARDFMFDALIASFPLAQTVLDADKAAVADRELSTISNAHDVLRENTPDHGAAVGGFDHRIRVADHHRVD